MMPRWRTDRMGDCDFAGPGVDRDVSGSWFGFVSHQSDGTWCAGSAVEMAYHLGHFAHRRAAKRAVELAVSGARVDPAAFRWKLRPVAEESCAWLRALGLWHRRRNRRQARRGSAEAKRRARTSRRIEREAPR